MISPLPGVTETKPGSATQAAAGRRRRGRRRERQRGRRPSTQGLLVLRRPWPGMLRTLYKEDDRFVETYYGKFGETTYLVGDAARKDDDGYFWILGRVDDVDQRLRPPPLDRGDRVGRRLPPEGGRVGGDRPARRDDRPGDLRLRHPRGRPRRHRRDRPTEIREHVADADLEDRAAQADHLGRATCRRPAPGRSCAGCCATSPRAASSAT